jgi:hypothetical protein
MSLKFLNLSNKILKIKYKYIYNSFGNHAYTLIYFQAFLDFVCIITDSHIIFNTVLI